jgi:UDP-GlcNAc:undecaprenyl-phosphate/decaprenyl-phosphate GlcNAc-1-phosphate transferase
VTPSQVSTNPVAATLLPLVVPTAIILLPVADVLSAVVRRTRHGQRPWQPDSQHLHHRMLQIGHGHRRAVLLLWLWAAVAAVGSVSFVFLQDGWVAIGGVLGLVVVAGVLTIWLPRWAPSGHPPRKVS